MKLYHSSKNFPKSAPNPVVALGNFDGVHLAHQAMFALAHKMAQALKGQAVAYTFAPHPVQVLSEAAAPPMINTPEQKLALLATQPLAATIIEPFDKKFATLSARNWFEEILVQRLHARGVVAGYDFTFGKKREGTVPLLEELTHEHGLKLEILPAQMLKNTLISSSQIRQFIQEGKIVAANALLGRPFFIEGKVITGAGRGKALGIPTANLKTQNECLPPRGVYVCRAEILGAKTKCHYGGVINIGINPTFVPKADEPELNIETHLFHFKQNIYGKRLKLEFIKRLRNEKTFSSAEKLVAQIHRDMEKAKGILKKLK